MRVLSLSYCFPNADSPSWGVFVMQRLAAMARRAELEVAAPVPVFPLWTRRSARLPAREVLGGLTVHRPRFFYVPGLCKDLDGWFYARGLRRWLREYLAARPVDLLDAHFVWPDGVGVARLARREGLPYAITLRGKIYPCLERPRQRAQCAEALRGAAAVLSVSGPMAQVARELGTEARRVHVIPNGVDTERFRPADRAAARRDLGLPADVPLAVLVGHLKPTKGHGEFVQALAALGPDAHAVIVGGEVERIRYRDRLRAQVEQLGLGGRVTLAGPQPYEHIPAYLAAADVVVLASHREGCPNVVLEALAAGRPVVATRVGAVPDIVTSDRCGRIVPPRDPAAMADALRDVLSRPWSAEDVRAAAAVRSWDQVAEEVLRVFGEALAPPAPPAGPGRADGRPARTDDT